MRVRRGEMPATVSGAGVVNGSFRAVYSCSLVFLFHGKRRSGIQRAAGIWMF